MARPVRISFGGYSNVYSPLLLVAINYAMTRTFVPEPTHHVFYDAGAGSVRATVVSFSSITVKDHPSSKTTKEATQLEVRGVGWARNLGGLEMDHRLRSLLAKDFPNDISNNARAQAKLLKEAARVKQVLSVNADSAARVGRK
jgi:hypoxia up-regulated 1